MSWTEDPIDLTLHQDLLNHPTAELLTPESEHPAFPDKRIYHTLAMLGAGAMGEVHLVRDALLSREVAYKQLIASEKVSRDDEWRFISEVQITAQLDHPYIVPIYSLEVTERGPAYTMKRIAGEDLKAWLKRLRSQDNGKAWKPELPLLLETFLKVCDAMAFAHSRGIVHRDLKPANIMIGPYHEVYIMDWGIARPFGESAKDYLFETQEKAQVIGTPRYMSPEQVRGANQHLDGRSDLFALGLILFEILSLQPAYQAPSISELLDKVRQAALSPLEPVHPFPVARELRAMVRKATALKRAHRYAGVAELAEDLRRYLNGEAVLAEPDLWWQKTVRQFKRHRVLALSGLLLVVLLSGLATTWNLWQRQQALQMAQVREQQRTQLFARVMAQGQSVDRQLLLTQRSLHILAGHSTQALQHGSPLEAPYYIENRPDFYARIPNPFFSEHYQNRLSLDWSGFSNAYQVSEAELKPQLKVLNGLHGIHRQIMLKTVTGGSPYAGDAKKLLAEEGVPLMFTNIVTKEGAYQFYPAIQYNTPNYDPRQRPFYLQALNTRDIQCGKAYLDRLTGSLLPCSLAIYDRHAEFLGTVSVDMQFKYLARHYLALPEAPAIQDSFLLNARGEVIVKASDQNQKIVKQDKIHTGYELQKLPIQSLQAAIARQEKAGLIETPEQIVMFRQLNFQHWYFVTTVDPGRLYSAQRPEP